MCKLWDVIDRPCIVAQVFRILRFQICCTHFSISIISVNVETTTATHWHVIQGNLGVLVPLIPPLCGYYPISLINFLLLVWSIASSFSCWVFTVFFNNPTSGFRWPASRSYTLHFVCIFFTQSSTVHEEWSDVQQWDNVVDENKVRTEVSTIRCMCRFNLKGRKVCRSEKSGS